MNHDKNYLTLTAADRIVLESYRHLLTDLGSYLGDGYELILHSLEDLQHSVIQIVGGDHSGRRIGAPITDFALSLLGRISEDKDHAAVTYLNRSKTGVMLRSTTLPITGENQRIIGLLCVNFYTDTKLDSLLRQFLPAAVSEGAESHEIVENFAENTDELIETTLANISLQVLADNTVTAQNRNKEIITALYHKGIFNIKDAVVKVAQQLEISKNTVYMHLRNIK